MILSWSFRAFLLWGTGEGSRSSRKRARVLHFLIVDTCFIRIVYNEVADALFVTQRSKSSHAVVSLQCTTPRQQSSLGVKMLLVMQLKDTSSGLSMPSGGPKLKVLDWTYYESYTAT